jgi:hypothetical protein
LKLLTVEQRYHDRFDVVKVYSILTDLPDRDLLRGISWYLEMTDVHNNRLYILSCIPGNDAMLEDNNFHVINLLLGHPDTELRGFYRQEDNLENT